MTELILSACLARQRKPHIQRTKTKERRPRIPVPRPRRSSRGSPGSPSVPQSRPGPPERDKPRPPSPGVEVLEQAPQIHGSTTPLRPRSTRRAWPAAAWLGLTQPRTAPPRRNRAVSRPGASAPFSLRREEAAHSTASGVLLRMRQAEAHAL